jgi:hypothetical protein
MNFGAFTPIKRTVIITNLNGTQFELYTASSFSFIKNNILGGRKIKSIKNRFL